jgi:hypothetical protein
MPDLEDVKGVPCSCDGTKWITVGETEYKGKMVPMQEPCPVCIPRYIPGEED